MKYLGNIRACCKHHKSVQVFASGDCCSRTDSPEAKAESENGKNELPARQNKEGGYKVKKKKHSDGNKEKSTNCYYRGQIFPLKWLEHD